VIKPYILPINNNLKREYSIQLGHWKRIDEEVLTYRLSLQIKQKPAGSFRINI